MPHAGAGQVGDGGGLAYTDPEHTACCAGVARAHAFFFFFNDTATTEIYTLSLHDALPIYPARPGRQACRRRPVGKARSEERSEEHTSELQSHSELVCRLLLEKKKKTI